MSNSPILIAGLARSGTTWLAKLIDSHPQTCYRHEPDKPPLFPDMPILLGDEQSRFYQPQISTFLQGLYQQNRVNVSGTLPVFRKSAENILHYYGRKVLTQVSQLAAAKLGNIQMLNVFSPPKNAEAKVCWKSVLSAGRLRSIIDANSVAPVIFILRNPCGVISSRYQGVTLQKMAPVASAEFEELLSTTHPLASSLLAKVNPSNLEELEAYRWALLNSHAIELLDNHKNSLIIRYEDLCLSPVETMQKVFDTLDLPWDKQVDKFIQASTTSSSSRFYGLKRKPENLDQWQQSMPSEIQDKVFDIVAQSAAGAFYQ